MAQEINRPKRLTLTLIAVEILLIAGFIWLNQFGRDNPDRIAPEFFERVGEVFGAAIGITTVALLISAYLWMRKRSK